MLAAFRSARRRSARGVVAGFAMAVALAGGAAMTSAVIAPAAQAQEYSAPFRTAYQPVQTQLGGDMPDWQAIRAALPAVEAAATTPDDLNAAGSIFIQAGSNLRDPALQRRGLEMRLQSGKVDPAQVGQFQYFVASLAFNDEDWADARTALDAATAAGYVDSNSEPRDDPEYLYMQTYMEEENPQAALDYVMSAAQSRIDAGTAVPEQWLLVALQTAYDEELTAPASSLAAMLVKTHPSERNWTSALQVLNAMNEYPPAVRLDLLRLQRMAGGLSQQNEYFSYVDAADPRVMANEVLAVLAEGVAANAIPADNPYYVESKGIAENRAAQDRESVDELAADGESGDGRLALATGDAFYSLGDYAQAEHFYQLAIDRGADRDTALTRLGISQVQQQNYAGAQQTFGQVSGVRAPIAQMWAAYAEQQAG